VIIIILIKLNKYKLIVLLNNSPFKDINLNAITKTFDIFKFKNSSNIKKAKADSFSKNYLQSIFNTQLLILKKKFIYIKHQTRTNFLFDVSK
jgi:hypothetical protein